MKKRFIRLVYFSLINALLLTSCASLSPQSPIPTARPVVVLKVSGSGTITTVLTALKPAFEAATPGYKLEVLSGSNTGNGVTGILEGLLDVAAMARAPKDEEIAKNIKYYEMGLVGQAIIVHPSVTNVPSLSKQQIADIFSGKVTNWAEVGGTNQQIFLFVRDEGDSSTKGLRKAVVGDITFPDTATTIFSQSDMAFTVEGTSGAIGVAAWTSILATKTNVLAVAIDGTRPDEVSYPILDSAGIGYLAERESDVQPLINWLSSTDGQAALKTLGFISPK
ncbi:Phosphate-binding protein PstS 1 [Anaerolineales bacterium]|nr:Phosphate-binding protein PstS 1 [Anaerolineales bacterium]